MEKNVQKLIRHGGRGMEVKNPLDLPSVSLEHQR